MNHPDSKPCPTRTVTIDEFQTLAIFHGMKAADVKRHSAFMQGGATILIGDEWLKLDPACLTPALPEE